MRSIQNQLNIRIVAGAAILLLGAGLVVDRRVTGALQEAFDRALRAKARALVSLSEQDAGNIEIDFTEELMPDLWRGEHPDFFQVWLGERLLAGSAVLGAAPLPMIDGTSEELRLRDAALPGGAPGRLVQLDYVPHVEGGVEEGGPEPLRARLVLARWRGDLDESIRDVRVMLGAVSGLLLLSIAFLVRTATRQGLAPLAEVGRQVQRLNAEVLHERVRVPVPVAELEPLVAKINSLLETLEAAFRRERQLSSDVAHELRTPVAELRSLAEVGGRWPERREEVEAFFLDVHEIALQMERIIASLLALARCEGGTERLAPEPVSLGDVVQASWSAVSSSAAARGLALHVQGGKPTAVTDAGKLRSIVDNLLGNAVAHAPAGTEIACLLGPGPSLSVSNLAPNLTEEDLPHLFERFWRKDDSRTGVEHAGLGLSLARAFAELLGGRLAAALVDGRLVMTLDLPASTAVPPATGVPADAPEGVLTAAGTRAAPPGGTDSPA